MINVAFLVAQVVKNLPAMWETRVQSLSWEEPLEKGTATHTTILAWRLLWTMGSQRVRLTTEQFSLSLAINKSPEILNWDILRLLF